MNKFQTTSPTEDAGLLKESYDEGNELSKSLKKKRKKLAETLLGIPNKKDSLDVMLEDQ